MQHLGRRGQDTIGRVAARLNEAKQKVWDLANQLCGFGRLWVPTGTPQALRFTALPAGSPLCSPSGRALDVSAHAARRKHLAWKEFRDRLRRRGMTMRDVGKIETRRRREPKLDKLGECVTGSNSVTLST